MARDFGYGEVPLTYLALTKRRGEFLSKVGDSPEADTLLFYQPSFGRGGKNKAVFGEFDAILVASRRAYLIESKWQGPSGVTGRRVVVDETQQHRHHIFKWYAEHWNSSQFRDWTHFAEAHGEEFKRHFEGKEIAPPDSKLHKNIEYVVEGIRSHTHPEEPEMKDVLLFFSPKGSRAPEYAEPNWFELVVMEYDTVGVSGWYEL